MKFIKRKSKPAKRVEPVTEIPGALAASKKSWQLSKRFRRRLIIMGIFIGGLFVFIHIASSPVHGRAIAVPVSAAKLEKIVPRQSNKPSVPASTLSNNYFSLNLPAGYAVQPNDPAVSGLLFSQTILKTSGDGSLILAVTVATLPSGGLTSDTSYTYRTQQPSSFKITNVMEGSDSVKVAAALSSDGVVAFWPHERYLATISASTGFDSDGQGSTPDELSAVTGLLPALTWK